MSEYSRFLKHYGPAKPDEDRSFCDGGTCGYIDICTIEADGRCRKEEDEENRAAAAADVATDQRREERI